MREAHATTTRRGAARFSDGAFVAAALVATALTALVAVGARTWIDHPFAGFFVRADRTIAPVGRGAWKDVVAAELYGRTLLAVDGAPVATSDDVHRRVAAKPVGSPVTYTVTDGLAVATVTLPSRRFSPTDYWAVFGAYLATGLCYVLLAILAAWARPGDRTGRALVYLGGVAGLYMLTAADLYPPAGSLRLHTLAAAVLPATLLQFALAVGDTRGRFASTALPVVWGVSLAAAASMQIAIGNPAETRWMDATCDAALGLTLVAAAVGLATRVRVAAESARLVAYTALFGLGVPAVVFLAASAFDGMPHNASATLAFLFPLGMITAFLRNDRTLGDPDVARSPGSL